MEMEINKAIRWLSCLKDSISDSKYKSLWHYVEPIDEIMELLEEIDERGVNDV